MPSFFSIARKTRAKTVFISWKSKFGLTPQKAVRLTKNQAEFFLRAVSSWNTSASFLQSPKTILIGWRTISGALLKRLSAINRCFGEPAPAESSKTIFIGWQFGFKGASFKKCRLQSNFVSVSPNQGCRLFSVVPAGLP